MAFQVNGHEKNDNRACGLTEIPGIQTVDHIYFHSILAVDDDTRKKYLEIAYLKGKNL
ncbi:MAG TPA: hypothetical protein VF346_09195 [Bacteroidales bacterium]